MSLAKDLAPVLVVSQGRYDDFDGFYPPNDLETERALGFSLP